MAAADEEAGVAVEEAGDVVKINKTPQGRKKYIYALLLRCEVPGTHFSVLVAS